MTNDAHGRVDGIQFPRCEARPIPHISLKELQDALANYRVGYERYNWGKILNVQARNGYYEVTCEYGKLYTIGDSNWLAHKNGQGLPQWWEESLKMAIHAAVFHPLEENPQPIVPFDEDGNKMLTTQEWLERWR